MGKKIDDSTLVITSDLPWEDLDLAPPELLTTLAAPALWEAKKDGGGHAQDPRLATIDPRTAARGRTGVRLRTLALTHDVATAHPPKPASVRHSTHPMKAKWESRKEIVYKGEKTISLDELSGETRFTGGMR